VVGAGEREDEVFSLEEIDEFEEILGSAPLRQGDLFEWVGAFRDRPWRELGVIVTADCDMANNKIADVVSFVPLLTFEDYIWHFWREKRFSTQRDRALQELGSFINKRLLKLGKAEISTDAARDWAERETDESLGAALQITDSNLKTKLETVWGLFSDLNTLLNAHDCDLQLLAKAAEHLKKSGQSANDFLALEFQNNLANLPGDVFYLSQVRREQGGAFAMLRQIRQCDRFDIAVEPDQIRFGEAKARRIARLRPTFKYGLTQQLARVFSDIGLPASYDGRVKNRAAQFFGGLSK
jgi:hypothetical protein